MQHIARKIEAVTALQEVGRVVRFDGEVVVVALATGDHLCRRAASCLLAPEAGDLGLVATTSHGDAYFLAVLERDAATSARIEVEGGLDLCVTGGALRVMAEEGAVVLSEKRVGVVSAGVDVNTEDANVTVGTLQLLTRIVRAESETVNLVAERVDTWMTRLSQKVQRVYRVIEDFEQVRAGRVDYTVKTSLTMHAENASVTATKLVHLDGEQIHLG